MLVIPSLCVRGSEASAVHKATGSCLQEALLLQTSIGASCLHMALWCGMATWGLPPAPPPLCKACEFA